jgi:hypothetical protein
MVSPAPGAAPTVHAAVLIGTRAYPQLSAADAPGADHDAIAMAAVVGRLGASVQDIALLVSPVPVHRPEVVHAGYGQLAEATFAHVEQAVRGLIAGLRASPEQRGVLFFAGHGATADGHLHLCTTDTTPTLQGTLSLETLIGWIGEDPLPGLTIVLDCCFAGTATTSGLAPGAPVLTLTPDAPETEASTWHSRLAHRAVVLAATGPGQAAYAYSLRPNMDRAQVVHGVFTWALSALLQRWSPEGVAQAALFPIRYRDLVSRIHGLCRDLAFDQAPRVSGPPGVSGWLVLRNVPGGDPQAPPLPGREISGGNNDSVVGDVYNGNERVGFYAGTPDLEGPNQGVYLRAGLTLPPSASLNVRPPEGSLIADGGPYDLMPTLPPLTGSSGVGVWNLDARAPAATGEGALLGSVIMVNDQVVWLWLGQTWPDTFVLTSGQPAALTTGGSRGLVRGTARANTFVPGTAAGSGDVANYTISDSTGVVGWLQVYTSKLVWWRTSPTPTQGPNPPTLPAWNFTETPTLALTFTQGLQGFSGPTYTTSDLTS